MPGPRDAFGPSNRGRGQAPVLSSRNAASKSPPIHSLPWQSVHDGEKLIHEPLRLSVVIVAPIEAMNAIIENHAMVRQLVDPRWLHLFAMDDDGVVSHHYEGGLEWTRLDPDGATPQIEAA